MPKVRTIFFDLGDTLMSFYPDRLALYEEVCAAAGIERDSPRLQLALRSADMLYHGALRNGHPIECSPAQARVFWQNYNEQVIEFLGINENRSELADAVYMRVLSVDFWRPYAEVKEVLTSLKVRGLQLAVISNFPDQLIPLCRHYGLADHFEFLIASQSVGMQKPDSDIFRLALGRAGATAHTSLHVGDNYYADILGARSVGIEGVLLDRNRLDSLPNSALACGTGSTANLRLDCPVITDLREPLAFCEN